jgi:tRNA synthetases class II (D, K and N)
MSPTVAFVSAVDSGNRTSGTDDLSDAVVSDVCDPNMGLCSQNHSSRPGHRTLDRGSRGVASDRLTMILAGAKSIRDVILFPLLRSQSGAAEAE